MIFVKEKEKACIFIMDKTVVDIPVKIDASEIE